MWFSQYLIACKQGKREERSISINNLLDFGFLKYPAFNCVSLPSDILTIFLSFPTSQKQSRNEFPLDNYLAARGCICFSAGYGGQKTGEEARKRMSALGDRSANEMQAFPWIPHSLIDHTITPSYLPDWSIILYRLTLQQPVMKRRAEELGHWNPTFRPSLIYIIWLPRLVR